MLHIIILIMNHKYKSMINADVYIHKLKYLYYAVLKKLHDAVIYLLLFCIQIHFRYS